MMATEKGIVPEMPDVLEQALNAVPAAAPGGGAKKAAKKPAAKKPAVAPTAKVAKAGNGKASVQAAKKAEKPKEKTSAAKKAEKPKAEKTTGAASARAGEPKVGSSVKIAGGAHVGKKGLVEAYALFKGWRHAKVKLSDGAVVSVGTKYLEAV